VAGRLCLRPAGPRGQVRERTRDLETANTAKSAFLTYMSHEIRTSLNSIVGMTTLALKTELDGNQRDFLSQKSDSTRLLVDIIRDVLDLSRIEAGRLELESVDFELGQLSRTVANGAEVVDDSVDRVDRNLSGLLDPLDGPVHPENGFLVSEAGTTGDGVAWVDSEDTMGTKINTAAVATTP